MKEKKEEISSNYALLKHLMVKQKTSDSGADSLSYFSSLGDDSLVQLRTSGFSAEGFGFHESCSRRSKRRGELHKDVLSARDDDCVKKNPNKIHSCSEYGKKHRLWSDDKRHSCPHDIQTTDTKKTKAVSRSNEDHCHVSRADQEASFHRIIKNGGSRSGDKCSSILHDIQITYTKKNKAVGRSYEDCYYVSRDIQEASSPRNKRNSGLWRGDKRYSSSHDIQITDTKKNKAVGRSYEDCYYVSRDIQEASSPRNKKNSGLWRGDKRYSSSHDIQITDTKNGKTVSRSYEDRSCIPRVSKEAYYPRYIKKSWSRSSNKRHSSSYDIQITDTKKNEALSRSNEDDSYVSGISQEASFPGIKKHRKPYRGSQRNRSSDENYASSLSRFSGNVSLHKGCNESSHLRSQIVSMEKQIDVTNSVVDSGTKKTLPQTHSVPNVAKGKRRRKTRWGIREPSSCSEFKNGIMDAKHDIGAVGQKNESLLDHSIERKQSNFVAVEGNQVLPSAVLKGLIVRQSPIRGVVDELNSPILPINKLDSSNEECASFSFQTEDEVLMDDSPLEHFGEQSNLDTMNGLRSVAINANNALSNGKKHNDMPANQEQEMVSLRSNVLEDITSPDGTKNQDDNVNLILKEALLYSSRKKLLILDLNGLLADINRKHSGAHKVHKRVGRNLVFKRPFCNDFLEFCFQRFHVAVWSSRKRNNVDIVVDYLMGNLKHKLLFCWDASKCTNTGYKTVQNKDKPLVLKELKKLWNKQGNDPPWVEGEYSPLNTLLVDDSPYKAICNPPHTAIFPYSFNFTNKDDNSLGPGGYLRVYLEKLASADDVQSYVREHPFGQKAITDDDPSWSFYRQIIDEVVKTPLLTS